MINNNSKKKQMEKYYPNLFSPIKIGNLTFKNRLFSGPTMMCQLTPQGYPNDYMIGYYETKAMGGAAQVTVGDTPVDEEHAPSVPRHPVLNKDSLTYISELAKAIKSHGAVASIELNHSGKESLPWFNPIGPVGFTRPDGVKVQAMDEALINRVADNYASAAALAKKAGFDMCLLHGAHGWLLGQFLSPLFNTRKDEYGGSLENRAKFPIIVIERVREAVGQNFPIEYRLSGSECIDGGLQLEEAIQFAKMIEDKIDLLHVSAALDTTREQAVMTHPTIFLPHGVNVKYAEAIKKNVNIPVVTVGAITDPEMAEEIISEGKADIVAMIRALIADPYFPNKAKAGNRDEIIPCIRCLDCLAGMHERDHFACSVNPWTGREFRMRNTILPAKERKRVLVVGGGPGGMMAAVTASERGHDVVLAEKNDKLGGILTFTDYDNVKEDLRRYKNYLITKVNSLNIEVRFNSEVTPDYVEQENPDSLIVAVGSEPVIPKIPGIENPHVKHALKIYKELKNTGDAIVIIGGGLAGCEIAIFMAELGKSVTVIEMQDRLAPEANWMHFEGMIATLHKNNVNIRTKLRCTEVENNGVHAINSDGNRLFFKADTVIYAVGMKAKTDMVEELRDIVTDFTAIGDCVRPRRVSEAVNEGYFSAVDLS